MSISVGVDFQSLNRVVNFESGEQQVGVRILIVNDIEAEETEQFRVVLSHAANSTSIIGSPSSANISIIDDDGESECVFCGTKYDMKPCSSLAPTRDSHRRADSWVYSDRIYSSGDHRLLNAHSQVESSSVWET